MIKRDFGINHLSVEVTNTCNLECKMCFKRSIEKPISKHMSIDVFKKALDGVKPTDGVTFIGLGEPLLNPDFFYMLLETRKRSLGVNMVTNGLLMNREWSRSLVRMNVSKISISLDGATKETYEKIRKGGDFDKVIENIKILVEERKKENSLYPFIRLDIVGMKDNIHELAALVRLAKELGVNGVSMLHLQPHNEEIEKQHLCNMPKEEVEECFKEALFEAWKSNLMLSLRPLSPSCDFCTSPWKNPYVDTNGNVAICCLTNQTGANKKIIEHFKGTPVVIDSSKTTFGNLYEQSFEEIWYNEKINDFRKKYNTIFREDMKKEHNMESFLKLRKDNKNPDCYCTVCARRFNMVC